MPPPLSEGVIICFFPLDPLPLCGALIETSVLCQPLFFLLASLKNIAQGAAVGLMPPTFLVSAYSANVETMPR
jgi:hypothetical protein